jgi:hypothetical protein
LGCCRLLEGVLLQRRAADWRADADADTLTLLALTYAQLAEAGPAGATPRARDVGDLVHLLLLQTLGRQAAPQVWQRQMHFPTLAWPTLLKLAAASLNAAGRLFRASPSTAALSAAAAASPASTMPPATEADAAARSWVLAADVADAALVDVLRRGEWVATRSNSSRPVDAYVRLQWDVVRAAARNGYAGSVDPGTGALRLPPSPTLLRLLASAGATMLNECKLAVQAGEAVKPREVVPAMAVALAEVATTGIADSLLPRQLAQLRAPPLLLSKVDAAAAAAAADAAASHLRAKYTRDVPPATGEQAAGASRLKDSLARTLHHVAVPLSSHRESLDVAYALALLDALERPKGGEQQTKLPLESMCALIKGANALLAAGEVGVGGVTLRRAAALQAAISRYNARRKPSQAKLPKLLMRKEVS